MPFGANRVGLGISEALPVYPDNRTFSVSAGMSETCQKRTHAGGKHQSISEASTEWDVTRVTRFLSIEMTL
jgi:hypothetical protein